MQGQDEGQGMSISYSAAWDDMVRTLRANSALLLPVAGVFLFLPTVVASYFAPQPRAGTIEALITHFADNWVLLLVVNLIGFVGNLALLVLALDGRRPTVAAAIRTAFLLLPAYFLVSLLSGFLIFLGLMLFVLPGLYLIGRLAATGPVLVAEGRRNPVDIVKRSFALTKGKGWAVLGLILLLFIAFYVVSLAITFVLGSALLLLDRAGGGGVGAFLLLVLSAAVGAAFNMVLVVLIAALYRRIAAAPSVPGVQ